MRAATAIVGAIAISSILIALAFVFSGGGSSEPTRATKTVTEIVRAPESKSEAGEPARAESGSGQFGGLSTCNGGEFTVENVSCEIGAQIHEQFEQGGQKELLAEDQEAGETITMSCSRGTSPVTCTGPGGAKVYFGE